MGDWFDTVADAFHLPRPPRVSWEEAEQRIAPMLLSFMSESRRLANARAKRELRVRLAYPTPQSLLDVGRAARAQEAAAALVVNDRAGRRERRRAAPSRELRPLGGQRSGRMHHEAASVGAASATFEQRIDAYERLVRLDKPIGILLLLWPTLSALWIAARGLPSFRLVLVFTLGTIVMRCAGCAFNDWADRRFDAHVKRTARRPLATRRDRAVGGARRRRRCSRSPASR